jgi:hypothetical protein
MNQNENVINPIQSDSSAHSKHLNELEEFVFQSSRQK